MILHGRIEHAAVILSDSVSLPEGTEVTVFVRPADDSSSKPLSNSQHQVQLPLVASKHPGTRRRHWRRMQILPVSSLSIGLTNSPWPKPVK